MIPALAFIPPNDVVNAFERLINLIRNQYGDAADRVLGYFEDTYIKVEKKRSLSYPKLSNSDAEYASSNS